ncbi:MFS transporter [uncultured Pseudokineococcus sp.]|uniref:MFS transporter n=1 Tax=uncultured Pseudokineococcus sp. TaxID=1642928 RepID=UPI00262ED74A|nr:MFS transporter [uncultured Pseudokineococcus sp.]
MPATETGPPDRLLSAPFVALSASELAYFSAQGALLPVVPLFVVDRLDAGVASVGAVVAVLSVTALALRPLAGAASDRWGPGALLVAGALVAAAAAAGHGAVDALPALVALRVALGAAEAAYLVAAVAALADLAPPHRRGEAMSYSSLGLYVGIGLGPLLGEALLRRAGFGAVWAAVALLAGAAALLALVVGARAPRDPGPPAATRPSRSRGRDVRRLVRPAAALTAGVVAAAGFLAFAALHARGVGLPGAGTVLLTYGGVVVATRLAAARLVDRGSPVRLVALALLLGSAGLALMAAVPSAAGLHAGAAVLAVGVALLTPSVYRLMVEAAPDAPSGTVAATFTVALDVGLGAGPLVFGLVAAGGGGTTSALAVGVGVALAGALVAASAGPAGHRRRRA